MARSAVPTDRVRLLDAAEAEFGRHGLAGASLVRIAAAAGVAPADVEARYGGKEQLFDTVVNAALHRLGADVAFAPDDLPGYAAALFDHFVAHPDVLRLTVWQALERPAYAAADRESHRWRVLALRAARDDGRLPAAFDPVDVLAVVVALAKAWALTSPALTSLAADGPDAAARLAVHRAAVVETVRRMVAPATEITAITAPPAARPADAPPAPRTGAT